LNDWHILGAGAIGCLFAANLQRSGVNCCLVLRTAGPANCDIHIESNAGSTLISVPTTPAEEAAPIRRLLVTTKAYDVERALQSVAHRLGSDSEVLIMTNGMGLLEIAARQIPGTALLAGTTTEGAFRTGARQIYHAGRGITRIGPGHPRDKPDWFEPWEKIPLECTWDPDIESALWHKLAINCAINPLTALHRVRNGELETSGELKASVRELCEEIALISEAAGFRETARLIARDTLDVIQRTADNKSSMLQDTLAGRPTEIDFITGYLIKRADRLGIAADRNRELLERIQHNEY
jgi:2-dehydropantoate 2-reductase